MVHKGSYTIEAAVWIPLFLLVVYLALGTGIKLYREVADSALSDKTESLNIVQEFYNYQVLEEVIKEVEND